MKNCLLGVQINLGKCILENFLLRQINRRRDNQNIAPKEKKEIIKIPKPKIYLWPSSQVASSRRLPNVSKFFLETDDIYVNRSFVKTRKDSLINIYMYIQR